MAKGVVKVRETGNVNQLEIENLGKEEVFVQSGDIVKGGQQDRTLMVSLLLPPQSGSIPIASFCVEQGRWSARGREDVKSFSTAAAAVPSREMKIAMKAPLPVAPAAAEPNPTQAPADVGALASRVPHARIPNPGTAYAVASAGAAETSQRQQQVWDNVRKTQAKLAERVGAPVRSAQSASSLQLALESEKIVDAQKGYVKALKAAGESGDDIIGYVFAISGEINSADVYTSNGLFRKMWAKLLTASAIEAIGHRNDPAAAAPTIEAVTRVPGGRGSRQVDREAAQRRGASGNPRGREGVFLRDRACRFAERSGGLGAPQLPGEVTRRACHRSARSRRTGGTAPTAASSSCARARPNAN